MKLLQRVRREGGMCVDKLVRCLIVTIFLLGKFEEAIAHFTEAITNYPTFAMLFAKRARFET